MSTFTTRRHRRRLLGMALMLAALTSLMVGSRAPQASADSTDTAVLDWNKHALDALVNAGNNATPGAGNTPPVSAPHLAMVQGAVYDAVNAIDGRHQPYLQGISAAPGASQAAAAATAAHGVLVGVSGEVGLLDQIPVCVASCLPTAYTAGVRTTVKTRLGTLLGSALSTATAEDGAGAVAAGVAVGEDAAATMLDSRGGDGRYPASPAPFPVGSEPGQWRPTSGVNDPFGWVRNVETFVVESDTQFLSKGPNALESGLYAKEYDEVKNLGAIGSQRTAEQQAMAVFFQPHAVEMFVRSLRTYAYGKSLSLAEQARFLGLVSLSLADAAITCWNDKERWSFWRPQTAIQLGEDDGNPKTAGDTGWMSFIPAPPYPEHASGFNCVAGSTTEVAEHFFGQGRTAFTLSHAAPPAGSPPGTLPLARPYEHFRDVCDDTIDARVYQGIHFRSADEAGAKIGRDVARWVSKHALERAK
jgi:hypothetical protein